QEFTCPRANKPCAAAKNFSNEQEGFLTLFGRCNSLRKERTDFLPGCSIGFLRRLRPAPRKITGQASVRLRQFWGLALPALRTAAFGSRNGTAPVCPA